MILSSPLLNGFERRDEVREVRDARAPADGKRAVVIDTVGVAISA